VRLDASELNRFGEALGRGLRPPAVIGLSGELGSGKTTLAQAICRGLGVAESATSPTYALVHRYEVAGGSIYHVDCYRLRAPEEARDLGFDDMAREGAIVLVEWPERAGSWLPRLDRHLYMAHDLDPDRRQVEDR
jgi:tRNA threonylcarbamoyladenosine biosynthesis protein TsaE